MSTVKSAYQTAFARQTAALSASVKKQTQALQEKKSQKTAAAESEIREIYTQRLRNLKALDQKARADGQSGGYVVNRKISEHGTAEKQVTETRSKLESELSSIQSQIDSKIAAAEQKQESLRSAYEKKMASLAESEAKAQAKASKSKSGSSSSGKKSTSVSSELKNKQSKALSMMKMGIYDPSFATLLNIPDSTVRDYVNAVNRKKNKVTKKTKTQH